MTYEFKSAFDRTLKRLPAERKERVKRAVHALIDFFEGGARPAGLGVKRLRADIWEARSGLADRILFHLSGSHAAFLIVGTHDDIRRHLRSL